MLVQSTVFWLLFLAVLPLTLSALEDHFFLPSFPPAERWPWIIFCSAGALGLYSGYTMVARGIGTPLPLDCPNRLVVHGPYRYVRNPMAVAGIIQGVAVGFLLGSPLTIAYSLAGAVLWHVMVRPLEEQDLLRRFGNDFIHYQSSVLCWWPRLSGYQTDAPAHRLES